MSLYAQESKRPLNLKLGWWSSCHQTIPNKDQKWFLALKNVVCSQMFKKLQVANEEHDYSFLLQKTVKA